MIEFEPKDISTQQVQQYILGGVAPRPIALVSTLSADGKRNLSPFSFFNAFGVNPPTIAFSPARRIRDGSTKHTYENLKETKECVVNAVTYSMVQQVNLASTEYEAGVDEFIKSGLKPLASDIVKPDRVADSPFQMECRLNQIINLGHDRGSGNLAICEIVKFHISEDIIDNGIIRPDMIDLVGRNSANYYTRANGNAIFEVEKPITKKGIGYDALPEFICNSKILTANNLGQLGNSESIPTEAELKQFETSIEKQTFVKEKYSRFKADKNPIEMLASAYQLVVQKDKKAVFMLEETASVALDNNNLTLAWMALLLAERLYQ